MVQYLARMLAFCTKGVQADTFTCMILACPLASELYNGTLRPQRHLAHAHVRPLIISPCSGSIQVQPLHQWLASSVGGECDPAQMVHHLRHLETLL